LQVAFDEAHTWLRKFAHRGDQGYPVATLPFYGPDDKKASKAVLGIILSKESEVQLHKWFRESPAADLRYDIKLQNAWIENPKIHEIRSASDMVHPASTPENPIIAAYVLVIRDRSPEGYIDDEFLNWNYILWWRRNHALNRELCLAGSNTVFYAKCKLGFTCSPSPSRTLRVTIFVRT